MVIDCQGNTMYNSGGVRSFTIAHNYNNNGALSHALTASQQARVCAHVGATGDAAVDFSEPIMTGGVASGVISTGNPTRSVCKEGYISTSTDQTVVDAC